MDRRSPGKQTVGEGVGFGGETHQKDDGRQPLTTNHGVPLSDNQNSLKLGARGPTLLEDFALREKIFHFDHERIPERIVHARGSGAHGYFECTDPIPELTRADLFQRQGEQTPVFVRFSTVAGGAGSVDTPRDVRGFAVKFYTREGNWDLVGNNIPVFFIQDAIKFPDLVHSVKMEADRAYPQAASAHDTFWDFASLMPVTTHMLMWTMSDRAIPRSYRTMQGFGVNTFRFVNAEGKSTFVKFHWKPKLGIHSLVWDEALKLQAADNDFHRRDLFTAIARGDFPEWELGVQTFDEETADRLPFDILDATKLVPEETVPVRIIGRLVLDRNPDNFFAEVEQVAFLPTNVPPGIDFTNDPLLQGRLFSYLDTQKSRLGTTNFHLIPVNAPKCPMRNFQRDGMMQMRVPKGRANYEPNSLKEIDGEGGPRETEEAGFVTFPDRESSGKDLSLRRIRSETFRDHYSQARMFWRSMTDSERAHIATAFVFELSKVEAPQISPRMVANLRNVDEELARRVAAGIGIPLPDAATAAAPVLDMPASDALSIQKQDPKSLQGKCVGILFHEGSKGADITRLIRLIEEAGAVAKLVAPRLKGTTLADGKPLDAHGQLAGTPSALFDAVCVCLTAKAAAQLSLDSAAVDFVADAFAHLKGIGATPDAAPLMLKAGVEADSGITALDESFVAAAAMRHWDREPKLRLLA